METQKNRIKKEIKNCLQQQFAEMAGLGLF
jgi:hypothetical protein